MPYNGDASLERRMNYSDLRKQCKRQSGYIITFFTINEISLFLTWCIRKTRITPNQVTIASIIAGLICAAFYATGHFVSGSLSLFISHLLDCTDGNLARVTGNFSPIGTWLDKIGDRLCEAAILIGVGIYFHRVESNDFWAVIALLEATFLLLYFYIVDLGLSMKITDPSETVGGIKIHGVNMIWGIIDPFIYGFLLFGFFGLMKFQIALLSILITIGIIYQSLKIGFISQKNSNIKYF